MRVCIRDTVGAGSPRVGTVIELATPKPGDLVPYWAIRLDSGKEKEFPEDRVEAVEDTGTNGQNQGEDTANKAQEALEKTRTGRGNVEADGDKGTHGKYQPEDTSAENKRGSTPKEDPKKEAQGTSGQGLQEEIEGLFSHHVVLRAFLKDFEELCRRRDTEGTPVPKELIASTEHRAYLCRALELGDNIGPRPKAA